MQVISQRIPATILREVLQNILIGVILVFSVLLVLQQANPARSKLGRDSGAYIYIGSHILRGEPPYLTAWDSKPPGIFLLDAVGLWLGKGTRWGIWLIEVVSLSTATWLGFLTMRRHFGLGAALPASLLWLYGLNRVLIGGNLTEEYSLFFGFLSLFLFSLSMTKKATHWLDIGIGICAGGSLLFRPNNTGVQISIVLAIAVLMLFEKKYLELVKRLIILGVSVFIPLGALLAYLLSKDALLAFWESTIIYNFFSYAGAHLFDPISAFFSGMANLSFAAYIGMIGLIVSALILRHDIKKKSPHIGIILWIILNGLIEIMFSSLSGRNYKHYFINWLPFIAVSSALLITRSMPWFVEWTRKKTTFFLLITAMLFGIAFHDVPGALWKSTKPLRGSTGRVQYIDPVSEYVNINTEPDQTVLVWGGQAGINFLARRDSPVAYLFFPLGVPSNFTNKLATDYYHDLVSAPPTLIIDGHIYGDKHVVPISAKDPLGWLSEHQTYAPPYLIEVLLFIHKNYTWEDNVDGVDIYRFKQ